MKNSEIAEVLREVAVLLEIRDEEYKPRAYREAARNVEALSEDVADVHERGDLEEIEGVGESIAGKIAEYLETGRLEYHERLKDDLPIDIEAITSVEGVGPKTAETLYRALGVATLEDLERAAREGRIAEVEGFGERSQQNILERVELAKRDHDRMLLGRAVPIARTVETRLRESAAFDRVEVVGSFRRRRPTVGDLDVLATADDPRAAMEAFCTRGDVETVLARGETKASVVAADGLQIDLRIVEESAYGAALVYFTGSTDHNIALRSRARDRGLKLNEYGLFDVDEVEDPRAGGHVGEPVARETESGVYGELGLEWVPPELREDTGEIGAAAADELPELIELGDVRGDLHVHTAYSDGSDGVREMAEAADERGLEYVLVSDHGPEAPRSRSLDREGFERQRAEVEELNGADDLAVTVLQGIEAEITEEGLGVPEEWCRRCDLVVAGLHTSPEEPTERVLRALETAPVDVFAHPTGRLIHEREPLGLDLGRIATVAADRGIAIEINARPERLDLDWASVKQYRDTVNYVVSTDAHAAGELEDMHLAVSQARRGWCATGDVLNTRPLEELRSHLGG